MGIPVRELQQRITSAEFTEYMASYVVDQRGGHYDDLRAGTIAALLANIHRDEKKNKRPFGVFDFLPWSEHHMGTVEEEKPVLLENPDEQSTLILNAMFPTRDA